jgi:hypothetical protein
MSHSITSAEAVYQFGQLPPPRGVNPLPTRPSVLKAEVVPNCGTRANALTAPGGRQALAL